jgi:tRNA pseudouridine32 synthase/23S rRNA pseudouridine746 synthase
LSPKTDSQNSFFTPLSGSEEVPEHFSFLKDNKPHPLCELAAEQLQVYLNNQQDWEHNFGLSTGKEGSIIGKMFGVLVVQTSGDQLGYLAAFSGKLAGGNHHAKFVPPVFDSLYEDSFLNNGMTELTRMNEEIKKAEASKEDNQKEKIRTLKTVRKNHSLALQNELFKHYNFLNQRGESKSLKEIFSDASYKNPPAGAGECAGPKLLQYAFQHQMKPLAIAEFWWGQSPKSVQWKHKNYYPCCKEKCEPILAHMLDGIVYKT